MKHKTTIAGLERRVFNMKELRMKEEAESREIYGYAALFGVRSQNLGWFVEIIEAGAFDGVLERSDVRALLNHDPSILFARSASGTLNLNIDDTGLEYDFSAPNTMHGNDLIELINRGDISQSSFAFTVKRASWEEEKQDDGSYLDIRHIHEIDLLYDVSPVTYPAYTDTTVAKRSLEHYKNTKAKIYTFGDIRSRQHHIRLKELELF